MQSKPDQPAGRRQRLPALLVVILLFAVGIAVIVQPSGLQPETRLARETQADALGLTGTDRALYVAEPGALEAGEGDLLLQMGDYWAHRVSYPTGRFDPAWVVTAAEEDAGVPRAVPAGRQSYAPGRGESPLALDPYAFTFVGPQPLQSNGCQGCFSYGKVAGRTNVIASDPVDPTVAYAGSDGGGVWKTENCCDANTTWTPVTDDPLLASIAIGDIVIDPNDHNTVYAGTGDLRFGSFSFGSAGLLKSTDAGATWTILGSDVFNAVYNQPPGVYPQYQAIGKVRVDPRDSNNVIVGTKQGVYFSYDAGENWSGPCLTNGFTTQRQDVTGMLVNDNGSSTDLFVAVGTRGFNTTVQPDLDQNGANGIYKTTVPASGCPASWDLLTRPDNGWPAGTGGGAPYPTNTLGRIDMAMAPSDPNIIYAQVASIPTRGQLGVWRTTDGGQTWQQRSDVNGLTGCFGDWPQNWYDQGVAIDPNNPDNVFISTVDLFRSVDGGTTFVNLTCGYAGGNDVHVDHHALDFVNSSSDTLLVGTDGGAYVSLNANHPDPNSVAFISLNDTLGTIEFYSGDITANFATSATPGINGGAQDNGSMVKVWNGDPGVAEWQLRTGGDGMYARIEPIQGQRWYQESQNGNLKVSTSGPFGTFVAASGAWGGDRRSFVFPYEIDKYDCDGGTICEHMIAGSYRVWETVQGAVPAYSWYPNSPDLTKNTLADRSFINQLSYAVSDNSVAIVGTNDGNVWYGFDMGQGMPNSATWVNVTGGNAVLPNRPIQDVTTDPNIPTVGYAAIGGFAENTPSQPGHVYQVTCNSDCSSFTWADKSGNLPNVPVNSILANPHVPEQIFAGTDWGLYFTNDVNAASPTWYKFAAGLPSVMIWDMAIDRGFTTLALFTRSRGAYVWPLPTEPATNLGDSSLTAEAGATVVHSFTLYNPTFPDEFSLGLSGGSWTTTLLTPSPVVLGAGESVTIEVQVEIPAGAAGGESDQFTLTATSANDASLVLEGTGTTTVEISGVAGVSTSGDAGASGVKGEVITYAVSITNTGTVEDTFEVSVGPAAWPVSVSAMSTGPLAPGAGTTLDVYVTIGTGNSDQVTVTFTSTFDNSVAESVTLTTTTYNVFLPSLIGE